MAQSLRARDTFANHCFSSDKNAFAAGETPALQARSKILDERTAQRQQWLDQARAGSNEARGQLLNSFLPMLWSYFNGQLSSELKTKVDPLDLAQSAFVRALPAFENFHGGDVAQMRDWLMTISIRLLIDLVEQYAPGSSHDISREQPLVDDADAGRHAYGRQPTPDEVLAALERQNLLTAALDKLDADERQVVAWRRDGLSYAAIADLLGLTDDAVERMFKRAVKTLRRALA